MGMLMLAAVLEKAGFNVHLLDANAARNSKSTEEIIQFSRKLKPDLVGMTLLTPMVREAYKLALGLQGNGAKLLAGGPHATLLPEEPLHHGFDAVVVGEGEPTIVEAAQVLLGIIPKETVKGLVYLDSNGRPVHTKSRPELTNLDDLPLPARHLVNPLDYGPDNGEIHSNLFSSRGCPGRCSYCAGHLFGKKFRFRSAGNVLDEMVKVHKAYETKHFHFVDDAITMDKGRLKEICQGLIEADMSVTWSVMTRVDQVNEELLALMARAGCVRIDYGVESGHPETLKRIHKSHTVEMVRRTIPLTAKFGIRPYVFFIFGFPWETPDDIEKTHKLLIELAPYVDKFQPAIASILIPFPGTEIYEKYKEKYGFEEWWLSEDRNYDAPDALGHPYYQSVIYRNGAVLDADFFHYSTELREKIYEAFKFMYWHSLRGSNMVARWVRVLALDVSKRLHYFSPSFEHAVFNVIPKTRRQ